MTTEMTFVSPGQTVQELWETSGGDRAASYVIGTADALVGVVRGERLAAAVEANRMSEPVSSLVEGPVVHGHPDHSSDVIMARLAESGGFLPIVRREQAQQVLGVVTFAAIMRFMRAR